MKAINPGHFLLTCRLDNWVHLLEENHFHIARDRLPQALYISATGARARARGGGGIAHLPQAHP